MQGWTYTGVHKGQLASILAVNTIHCINKECLFSINTSHMFRLKKNPDQYYTYLLYLYLNKVQFMQSLLLQIYQWNVLNKQTFHLTHLPDPPSTPAGPRELWRVKTPSEHVLHSPVEERSELNSLLDFSHISPIPVLHCLQGWHILQKELSPRLSFHGWNCSK